MISFVIECLLTTIQNIILLLGPMAIANLAVRGGNLGYFFYVGSAIGVFMCLRSIYMDIIKTIDDFNRI